MPFTPVRPSRLHSGDRIMVVSPSSTIADRADAAVRAQDGLARHLDVKVNFSEHALGSYFYSSGTTEQRQHDLIAAITDPDVMAVFFSTGGATAIDLIDGLDYDAISANPKIIAGLSDCSTILNAITCQASLKRPIKWRL